MTIGRGIVRRLQSPHVLLGVMAALAVLSAAVLASGCNRGSATTPRVSRQGSHVLVVAVGPGVLVSHDGGVSWSQLQERAAAPVRHVVVSVSSRVYATSTSRLLTRNSDGDPTWTSHDAPRGFQAACVAPVSDGSVLVGGTEEGHARLLATTNGGATWHRLSLDGSMHCVYAIASASRGHLWVVGSEGSPLPSAIEFSSDGGQKWTVQRTDPGSSWYGAVFADVKSGWVVGRDTAQNVGVVIRTDDGGLVWNRTTVSSVAGLTSVACSDSRHVWMVGNDASGTEAVVLSSVDGGAIWEKHSLPALSAKESVTGVCAADSTHVWVSGAAGKKGIVLYSHDGGKTWHVQASLVTSPLLLGIACSHS